MVGNVLQGYIKIFADVRLFTHHAQQVPWEVGRIGIMQANPLHSWNVGHTFHQFSNVLLTVNVNTIVRQFLGNDIQLLHALANQPAHLVKDFLHGTALVTPRNERNSTVSAMAVTALADFQVGIVPRGSQNALEFRRTRSNRITPITLITQTTPITLTTPTFRPIRRLQIL